MKNSQLNRVIDLVKKTNDRVVILDQESEEVLVLMPLTNYEKIVSAGSLLDNGYDNYESGDEEYEAEDEEDRCCEASDEADETEWKDDKYEEDDWDDEDSARHFSEPEIDFGPPPSSVLEDDFFTDNYPPAESAPATIKKNQGADSNPVVKTDSTPAKPSLATETENLHDIPSEEVDPPFYLEPVE